MSETSQLELFRTIQSRDKAGIGQAVGLFVVGELTGGIIGKAAGWALGKAAGTAAKGYDSFSAFKKAYGSAGNGMAWHHIVEQNASNISKFGAQKIHNINNVVRLPHGKGSIHAKISGYYSSKPKYTNGLTVRDWLKTKSFEEQYEFGRKVLKGYGW